MDESLDVKPDITKIGEYEVVSCCETEDSKVNILNNKPKVDSMNVATTQSEELLSSVGPGQLMMARERCLPNVECNYIKCLDSNKYNDTVQEPNDNGTDSSYIEEDVKPLTCVECNYACNDSDLMENHLMVHGLKKDISYNECSNFYPTNQDVKKRIYSEEIRFSCPECTYVSSRKSHLMDHIMTHTEEKPFSCTECNYVSNRKSSLRRHMIIHTRVKAFSCTDCSFVSSRKSSLRHHMITHTEEKHFSCPDCTYVSSYESSLKRHMVIHTGEKPFSCTDCTYASSRKSHLRRHIMIHTDEKPFYCTVCAYVSSRKSSFSNHIRTHTEKKHFLCPDIS